jgi:uncharacterized protein (TIGR02246 family)
MKTLVAACVLIFCGSFIVWGSMAQESAEQEIRKMPQSLTAAWDKSDSQAMASLFADDGDLVIPSGDVMSGRAAIQSFYQAVFARGYKGSHAGSEIKRVRIAGNTAIIDGTWSINGVSDKNGTLRPAEAGLFTALLERKDGKWYIVALREMVPIQ